MISAIVASLSTVLSGYALSFMLGVALGVLCSLYVPARKTIKPLVNIMRPVSAIALYPAIVTVLGIGWWSRVFVLMWVSLPVVLLNTLHALDSVEPEVIDAARLETGKENILLLIRLPIALRSIVSTLNVTISTTWIGLTAAEMLGASDGLGFKILEAAQSFNYPVMWAYILTIAGIGYLMSTAVQKLYERMEIL